MIDIVAYFACLGANPDEQKNYIFVMRMPIPCIQISGHGSVVQKFILSMHMEIFSSGSKFYRVLPLYHHGVS